MAERLILKGEARGGKYIRRVPYIDAHGHRRYRYFYRDSAIARDVSAGEDVKLGDRSITVEAIEADGTIVIREGAHRQRVAPDDWGVMLRHHYGDLYQKAAEKRAHQAMNAVLRHVPRALLMELQGDDDAARLRDLERRAPMVYKRLQAAFRRAGVDVLKAKSIIDDTLRRRGWEPESRAAAIGSVLVDRGAAQSYSAVLDAAQNLAGASQTVTPGHVQAAFEMAAGGPSGLAARIRRSAVAAEKAVGDLQAALDAAPEGPKAADVLVDALASKSIQQFAMLLDAFPGIRDRARDEIEALLRRLPAIAPAAAPKTDGAATTVYVSGPNGKPTGLKARYKLIEAGDAIASHDPQTFSKRADYPAQVQERQYHSDRAEQGKVIRNAQNLDPQFVANTNPDATNGPPMMTESGVVLGGNSRTMSMQRVYSDDGAKARELRQYLTDNAQQFGFTADDVGALKNPMLVRVVEVADQSRPNLALLVRQMNETFTQGMDPRTMQVALGRKLSDRTVAALGQMDPDETLNAFLGSSRAREFLDGLRRDGVIDERNINQYTMRGDASKLNEDGRTLVARILTGRLVGDADLLSNAPANLVQALAISTPSILQSAKLGGDFDISEQIRIATDAFIDLRAKVDAGVEPNLDPKMSEARLRTMIDSYFGTNLFGESHPVSSDPVARRLLEHFVTSADSPRKFGDVFRAFAEIAAKQGDESQGSLLGGRQSAKSVLDAAFQRVSGVKKSGPRLVLAKGGPYIGPRGGKWADPQHTIPWHGDVPLRSKGADFYSRDWSNAPVIDKLAVLRDSGVSAATVQNVLKMTLEAYDTVHGDFQHRTAATQETDRQRLRDQWASDHFREWLRKPTNRIPDDKFPEDYLAWAEVTHLPGKQLVGDVQNVVDRLTDDEAGWGYMAEVLGDPSTWDELRDRFYAFTLVEAAVAPKSKADADTVLAGVLRRAIRDYERDMSTDDLLFAAGDPPPPENPDELVAATMPQAGTLGQHYERSRRAADGYRKIVSLLKDGGHGLSPMKIDPEAKADWKRTEREIAKLQMQRDRFVAQVERAKEAIAQIQADYARESEAYENSDDDGESEPPDLEERYVNLPFDEDVMEHALDDTDPASAFDSDIQDARQAWDDDWGDHVRGVNALNQGREGAEHWAPLAKSEPRLTMAKAGSHKYTRRWRGPDGKWQYEYPEDRQQSLTFDAPAPPEPPPVAVKRAEKIVAERRSTIEPMPTFTSVSRESFRGYEKRFRSIVKKWKTDLPAAWREHEARRPRYEGDDAAYEEAYRQYAATESEGERAHRGLRAELLTLVEEMESVAVAIGHDMKWSANSEGETRAINEAVWKAGRAREALGALFPQAWDYRTGKHRPRAVTEGERGKLLRQAQQALRTAISGLELLVTSVKPVDVPNVEQFEANGFRFEVGRNSQRLRDSGDGELTAFVAHAETARGLLDRAGFTGAHRGMTITLLDVSEDDDVFVAGRYRPDTDRLHVHRMGINKGSVEGLYETLIHEIGHRYRFQKIPPAAWAAWEEHFARMKEGGEHFRVPLTDYGETNPDEAYADAFRLYVLHGPRALHPEWRDAFERVSRAAGWMKKSEPVSALRKSRMRLVLKKSKPPGAGWQIIPGGKHGGYRRRRGAKWEYWYPDAAAPSKAGQLGLFERPSAPPKRPEPRLALPVEAVEPREEPLAPAKPDLGPESPPDAELATPIGSNEKNPQSSETARQPPPEILWIKDTREREPAESPNGKEYLRPIPGTGDLRACDRCGRMHEVHAGIRYADGRERIVGTGCMGTSMEYGRSIANLAIRIATKQAEFERAQQHMVEWEELKARVARLKPPEPVHGPATRGEVAPWRGDITVGDVSLTWVASPLGNAAEINRTKQAETEIAIRWWRQNRLEEMVGSKARRLQLENAASVVAKFPREIAALERTLESKTKGEEYLSAFGEQMRTEAREAAAKPSGEAGSPEWFDTEGAQLADFAANLNERVKAAKRAEKLDGGAALDALQVEWTAAREKAREIENALGRAKNALAERWMRVDPLGMHPGPEPEPRTLAHAEWQKRVNDFRAAAEANVPSARWIDGSMPNPDGDGYVKVRPPTAVIPWDQRGLPTKKQHMASDADIAAMLRQVRIRANQLREIDAKIAKWEKSLRPALQKSPQWRGTTADTGGASGPGRSIPQPIPDFETIYGASPLSDRHRKERAAAAANRRVSTAARNSGKFGFHGQPPALKVQLRYEGGSIAEQLAYAGEMRGQRKPVVRSDKLLDAAKRGRTNGPERDREAREKRDPANRKRA